MKNRRTYFRVSLTLLLAGISFFVYRNYRNNPDFVSYTVNLKKQSLKLYWKNESGLPFRSLGNLKKALSDRGETLVFAMNGGMYKADNSPQGLLVERGKKQALLDTLSGEGNFYMKPNGVFYTTTNKEGFVCKTEDFRESVSVEYATQSGPMLLINGRMHPAFKKGSVNINIRNGVGLLPSGKLLFAMSRKPVNFYDFATYFQNNGCKNALYLDGLVSRTYLPAENREQLDGDFGVIIGVSVLSE